MVGYALTWWFFLNRCQTADFASSHHYVFATNSILYDFLLYSNSCRSIVVKLFRSVGWLRWWRRRNTCCQSWGSKTQETSSQVCVCCWTIETRWAVCLCNFVMMMRPRNKWLQMWLNFRRISMSTIEPWFLHSRHFYLTFSFLLLMMNRLLERQRKNLSMSSSYSVIYLHTTNQK